MSSTSRGNRYPIGGDPFDVNIDIKNLADDLNLAALWDEGTSFPSTPRTGLIFRRNDLGATYVWDGTAWTLISKSVDVQIFTSSATWTKPTGAKRVRGYLIGGGGAGAGGNTGIAGTSRLGGGAGAPGGFQSFDIAASALTGTQAVTIGAGGTGGAGGPTTGGSGSPISTVSGGTVFGPVTAYGGGRGIGSTGAGGFSSNLNEEPFIAAGWCSPGSLTGVAPGNIYTAYTLAGGVGTQVLPNAGIRGPGAGSGGNGITSSNVVNSFNTLGSAGGSAVGIAVAGTRSATAPTASGAGADSNVNYGGGGGSGGPASSSSSVNGGAGGAGGLYGGGGGGGGAAASGGTAVGGAGGNGGSGIAVIITDF